MTTIGTNTAGKITSKLGDFFSVVVVIVVVVLRVVAEELEIGSVDDAVDKVVAFVNSALF